MPNKVKVDAGKYRDVVHIVAPQDASVPSTGEPLEQFDRDNPKDWDWANVEPLSSRELLGVSQVEAVVDYRVKMRYRPDLTTRHKLLFTDSAGKKVFLNITKPPIDREGRGIELEILCSAEATTMGG